jgi:hypothetical protein
MESPGIPGRFNHRSQHSIVIELLEKALKQVKVPKEGKK